LTDFNVGQSPVLSDRGFGGGLAARNIDLLLIEVEQS